MYKIKCKVHNLKESKIFRVSKQFRLKEMFSDLVIKVYDNNLPIIKYKHFITTQHVEKTITNNIFISDVHIDDIKSLNDKDIILVTPDGSITKLWNINTNDNLLFLTDYCNSKCVMCPQTECSELKHYYEQSQIILGLINKKPQDICLSGGEPTFLKNEYLKIVKQINKQFPNVFLYVLTNGKNFSNFDFVKQCVLNSPLRTTYAIPIYSPNVKKHDYIVGAQGSFKNTIYGLYNLYKFKQNIEIRIVITKINYTELLELSHFIYWNLPFVNHIAFIGMETHGNAMKNFNEVWIEPQKYMDNLSKAIEYLDERSMNVSIFNLPFCILPAKLYKFARDSISSWKKYYLPECENCKMKETCSGFFSTSCNVPKGIKSI